MWVVTVLKANNGKLFVKELKIIMAVNNRENQENDINICNSAIYIVNTHKTS
jgi:hypothetical protein